MGFGGGGYFERPDESYPDQYVPDYGNMYMYDAAQNVADPGIGNYGPITPGFTAGPLRGIILTTADRLTIRRAGIYKINIHVSWTDPAAARQNGWGLSINGVIHTPIHTRDFYYSPNGQVFQSVSCQGMVSLSAADYLQIIMKYWAFAAGVSVVNEAGLTALQITGLLP